MRHNFHIDSKVLFVKTSSLGDIIQSFHALSLLKCHYPNFQVDWVVEKAHASLVKAHPLVQNVIEVDFRGWKKHIGSINAWKTLFSEIKALRRSFYDFVFDLQGNTKSGVLTFFTSGKDKIGFGPQSVREWPNLMATSIQYEIDPKENICHQYESLIERHFEIVKKESYLPFRLKITDEEEKYFQSLPLKEMGFKVMVCPGSNWPNKQLDPKELLHLLKLMQDKMNASFLLIWGNSKEKELALELHAYLKNSFMVDRLSIPAWQNLMWEVDFLLGVDSAALHLCSTTPTKTFSFFGPTSLSVFKPAGENHQAHQGKCPYGVQFDKLCPRLRTCPTGACIRSLKAELLFNHIRCNAKTPRRKDAIFL